MVLALQKSIGWRSTARVVGVIGLLVGMAGVELVRRASPRRNPRKEPASKYKAKVIPDGNKKKKRLSQLDEQIRIETAHVNKSLSPEVISSIRRMSVASSGGLGLVDELNRSVEKKMHLTSDENWVAFLALLGYLLSILEAEMMRANHLVPDSRTETLKVIVSLTTLSMLWFVGDRCHKEYRLQKLTNLIPPETPFLASAQCHEMFWESIMFLCHPLPYVDVSFEVSSFTSLRAVYCVDEILVMMMFTRLYTILPLIHR